MTSKNMTDKVPMIWCLTLGGLSKKQQQNRQRLSGLCSMLWGNGGQGWGMEGSFPSLSRFSIWSQNVLWSSNLEKESRLQAAGRKIRKCQSITRGLLWVISWLTWLARNQWTWAPSPILSLPPTEPLSKHIPQSFIPVSREVKRFVQFCLSCPG